MTLYSRQPFLWSFSQLFLSSFWQKKSFFCPSADRKPADIFFCRFSVRQKADACLQAGRHRCIINNRKRLPFIFEFRHPHWPEYEKSVIRLDRPGRRYIRKSSVHVPGCPDPYAYRSRRSCCQPGKYSWWLFLQDSSSRLPAFFHQTVPPACHCRLSDGFPKWWSTAIQDRDHVCDTTGT